MRTKRYLCSTLISSLAVAVALTGCGMPDMDAIREAMSNKTPQKGELFPGETMGQAVKDAALPAQKQQLVRCMMQGVAKKLAPIKAYRTKIAQELAKGVAAGSIDQARLAAIKAELKVELQSKKPVLKQFLTKLHCALEPSERAKLADAFMKRKAGSSANASDGAGSCTGDCGSDCGGKGGKSGKLKGLFSSLGLSRDQKMAIMQSISVNLVERPDNAGDQKIAAMRLRFQTLATAFKSDTFDTSALEANKQDQLPAGIDRIVQMLGIILPVLTAEQRTALAQQINDKVSQGGSKGASNSKLNDAPISEQTCAQLAKTLLASCAKGAGTQGTQGQKSSGGCKHKAGGGCKHNGGGCKQRGGCKQHSGCGSKFKAAGAQGNDFRSADQANVR